MIMWLIMLSSKHGRKSYSIHHNSHKALALTPFTAISYMSWHMKDEGRMKHHHLLLISVGILVFIMVVQEMRIMKNLRLTVLQWWYNSNTEYLWWRTRHRWCQCLRQPILCVNNDATPDTVSNGEATITDENMGTIYVDGLGWSASINPVLNALK